MTYGRSNLRLVFRRGAAYPVYLDPGRDGPLVEAVIGFYEEAAGLRMGDVEWEELRIILGNDRLFNAFRAVMGRFYKASKKCPSWAKPEYLRSRVYLYVNEKYGGYAHPSHRNHILGEIGETPGVEELEDALWCDLPEELVVERVRKPTPGEVIAAYNYETMDTVLSSSDSLEVWVREARSPGAAALARLTGRICRLKGLVYDASMDPGGLRIRVAGPGSIFGRSARYGSRLTYLGFKLLKTLIGIRGAWRLTADMRTSTGKQIHVLLATHTRTPYLGGVEPPEPKSIYDSSVEENIARILGATGIRVEREAEPLVLPAGLLYIPDLVARGPRGKAYIEIMGYWRREYAEKKLYKLAELVRAGTPIIVVADARHRETVGKAGLKTPVYYYTVRQGKPILPYGSLVREIKRLTGLK